VIIEDALEKKNALAASRPSTIMKEKTRQGYRKREPKKDYFKGGGKKERSDTNREGQHAAQKADSLSEREK